eukprot:1195602-Prorocentrum_minimum.AAC.4
MFNTYLVGRVRPGVVGVHHVHHRVEVLEALLVLLSTDDKSGLNNACEVIIFGGKPPLRQMRYTSGLRVSHLVGGVGDLVVLLPRLKDVLCVMLQLQINKFKSIK